MSTGRPFATARAVEVQQLIGQIWVASRSGLEDTLLGVWPGLAKRPDVRYVVRDWFAKLQIVAAGLAITTLPRVTLGVLPDGVTAVAVRGEPQETRRVVLARHPGPLDGPAARVADALIAAAATERFPPDPTRQALAVPLAIGAFTGDVGPVQQRLVAASTK